jgi:hypothetical protein
MSAKKICLGGLVVALLGWGAVRGQSPDAPYGDMAGTGGTGFPAAPPPGAPPPGAPPPGAALPPPPPPQGAPPGLSDWVAGCHGPRCCGPVGGNGPLVYEAYARGGVVFPVSGNLFGRALDVGWAVEAGGRSLFFNPEMDAAWTVDLGIANFNNTSGDRTTTHPLFNVQEAATTTGTTTVARLDAALRSLNRTTVNVAGGREVWLWGTAECGHDEPNLRVGWDLGGRYGTAKLDLFHAGRHRTDVIGGVFAAAHADLEAPLGGCTLVAGVRGEWGYTWTDILQRQNNGDVEDLNLLFTLGVRY